VGPEYLALLITLVISGVSGGSWTANKIVGRFSERARQIDITVENQERKLDNLEEKVNRLPLDYVLKVDFLREIKEMHDNFKQINMKLDKLVEKLLTK
jgi:predicted RNase H-like nuclease (RuvC/YqgF family)